jgi:hypothetical protein
MNKILIHQVALDDVIQLRMHELDLTRSYNEAISAGDTSPEAVHFAAFDEGQKIGVGSLGP